MDYEMEINAIKSELKNFYYLQEKKQELYLKLLEVGNLLQGVSSVRYYPTVIENKRTQHEININKYETMMLEGQLEDEYNSVCVRLNKIERLLKRLNERERNIIMSVYIDGKRLEDSVEKYMNKKTDRVTAYRLVDKMILKMIKE